MNSEERKKDKVCILICSHNFKELTDRLCEQIISNTKIVDFDLHVIETGSSLNNCSKYMTLWVEDQCRMTRGWNLLKQYADSVLSYKSPGESYFSYMLFVNDAYFIDNQDLVGTLYKQMKALPDAGQIHPYQNNIGVPFNKYLGKQNVLGVRKTSFSEIICPMIKKEAWDICGVNLLDNRFYYGWGLDYDIPYQLHSKNWRSYISDEVGVYHSPFTSYNNKEITKETMDKTAFMQVARQNMNQGFENKYGNHWKKYLIDSIPEDVDPMSLYLWLNINDGYTIPLVKR